MFFYWCYTFRVCLNINSYFYLFKYLLMICMKYYYSKWLPIYLMIPYIFHNFFNGYKIVISYETYKLYKYLLILIQYCTLSNNQSVSHVATAQSLKVRSSYGGRSAKGLRRSASALCRGVNRTERSWQDNLRYCYSGP